MIRISAPFTSVCQRIARCLPQARYLSSENVAIGQYKSLFLGGGGKATGRRSCSRLANYAKTFERNVFTKSPFLKSSPYCDESVTEHSNLTHYVCNTHFKPNSRSHAFKHSISRSYIFLDTKKRSTCIGPAPHFCTLPACWVQPFVPTLLNPFS